MRKISRISAFLLLSLAILATLYILILAYPSPLFTYSFKDNNLRVHFSGNVNPANERIGLNVLKRIRDLEVYNIERHKEVYVCESDGIYSFFTSLAMIPDHVPGFNLSYVNNSFVSVPLIQKRNKQNGGFPPYSALEGNLEQSISHELVHNFVEDALNDMGVDEILPWKMEGYCEYGASIAIIKEDSSLLIDRIGYLNQMDNYDDRGIWFYENGLIIEYLIEIEKVSFGNLIRSNDSRDLIKTRMMNWYENNLQTETDI